MPLIKERIYFDRSVDVEIYRTYEHLTAVRHWRFEQNKSIALIENSKNRESQKSGFSPVLNSNGKNGLTNRVNLVMVCIVIGADASNKKQVRLRHSQKLCNFIQILT